MRYRQEEEEKSQLKQAERIFTETNSREMQDCLMWTLLKKILTVKMERHYQGNVEAMKNDPKNAEVLEAVLKQLGPKPFCKTFCQVAMDMNVQMNNIYSCYQDIVTDMSRRTLLKSEVLAQVGFNEKESLFLESIEVHFRNFVPL